MIKYTFIAILIAIVAFALWFNSWTGPEKLNFADRAYLGSEGNYTVKTGIAYGKDARQKLDVYTPVTKAGSKPQPILVFFHGGSWRDGDRESYAFVGRAFAAQGFVAVIADYRKSPEHRFPGFVEDAANAIAWTHINGARYQGDTQRLFVIGHSAGAHISMLAVLDPKYLARSKLDSAVIKGVIGLAGPYDFLPFTGEATKEALGHWPRLQETQPISYARSDTPPLLLLTGDKDETVKPRNSMALAVAVQDVGGTAEVKTYPGVDHYGIIMAVSRPFRTKAPVIEDVLKFASQE
jgi:acetyl esterase/lipase